jgi:hypothetical protein
VRVEWAPDEEEGHGSDIAPDATARRISRYRGLQEVEERSLGQIADGIAL